MSKEPNHRGDLEVEAASKQDFGWFEERLTLMRDGSLRVQSGYGDASNGDESWYQVDPNETVDDLYESVRWPTPEQLGKFDVFCNPGVDQSKDLTELLGLEVEFRKHGS